MQFNFNIFYCLILIWLCFDGSTRPANTRCARVRKGGMLPSNKNNNARPHGNDARAAGRKVKHGRGRSDQLESN